MEHHRAGLATYPLSPTQRKDVMLLVVGWQLDPNEFEWSLALTRTLQVGLGREPVTVDRLTHKPTGYFFLFDFDRRMRHHGLYRPGADAPEVHVTTPVWEVQKEHVNLWLSNVKREYETPDVWALVRRQRALGALPPAVNNTPFTAEEQAQIEAIIDRAIETARGNHELTETQERLVKEKRDFLVEASKQLGRLHWRTFVIGVMAEAVIEDVLPRGFVGQLIDLTLRGLSAVFGGPDFGELPRPGP